MGVNGIILRQYVCGKTPRLVVSLRMDVAPTVLLWRKASSGFWWEDERYSNDTFFGNEPRLGVDGEGRTVLLR